MKSPKQAHFSIFLCFFLWFFYVFNMFPFMIFLFFFMIPRGASPQVWVGRGAVAGKVAARSVGCAVAPRELLRPKCRGRWEVTWSWPGQQTPSLPGLWPALWRWGRGLSCYEFCHVCTRGREKLSRVPGHGQCSVCWFECLPAGFTGSGHFYV